MAEDFLGGLEDQNETATLESGEPSEESGQRFAIGLDPFGRIGINVTDVNGQTAGYLISNPEEASRIAMHLIALTTMMIQGMYAQAMQEQQLAAKLLADPEGAKKLWTPQA